MKRWAPTTRRLLCRRLSATPRKRGKPVRSSIDTEVAAVGGIAGDGETELEQSGKRTRCANVRYADFWRHTNDKGEDLEVPGLK
jgi:hypothetical protein